MPNYLVHHCMSFRETVWIAAWMSASDCRCGLQLIVSSPCFPALNSHHASSLCARLPGNTVSPPLTSCSSDSGMLPSRQLQLHGFLLLLPGSAECSKITPVALAAHSVWHAPFLRMFAKQAKRSEQPQVLKQQRRHAQTVQASEAIQPGVQPSTASAIKSSTVKRKPKA